MHAVAAENNYLYNVRSARRHVGLEVSMKTIYTRGGNAIIVHSKLATHQFDSGVHATAALFLILGKDNQPDRFEVLAECGSDWLAYGEARMEARPPEADLWECDLLDKALQHETVRDLIEREHFDSNYFMNWSRVVREKLIVKQFRLEVKGQNDEWEHCGEPGPMKHDPSEHASIADECKALAEELKEVWADDIDEGDEPKEFRWCEVTDGVDGEWTEFEV